MTGTVRGFDHEPPMSPCATDDDEPWPGVLDTVPDVFRACVEETAFTDEFDMPYLTVCLWLQRGDPDLTFSRTPTRSGAVPRPATR